MSILNNSEANKLNHIEITLAKCIESLVNKLAKNIPYFESDTVDFYVNAETSRAQEIISLRQNIQYIVKSLKSKIELLGNRKVGEIKDYEQFKEEMVDVQEKIINLKRDSKSELSKLKALEENLNDELIMYYNEKVAEWSMSVNISNHELMVPSRIKSKNSTQYKEVKQFLEFVHQSGGHENGWRKEDHLLFLKLRGKYKKIEDIAFHLHDTLPDISIEEIKLHEEWYKKYLNLQSKKKEAILKWKQNNCKHKGSIIENKDNSIIDHTKEESSKLREKLMQWKLEKEEKIYEQRGQEKQKLLEKIERDRLKKQRQIEIKKIVNEWRESKITYEQSQKQEQRIYEELEKKRRAANANKLIKQFQSMDELHVLRMRQVHKKLAEAPKKRVQSGPPVLRDPKRLMQPTIQWAHRVRTIREPLQRPIPIFAMPKLAIPDWRKSVM